MGRIPRLYEDYFKIRIEFGDNISIGRSKNLLQICDACSIKFLSDFYYCNKDVRIQDIEELEKRIIRYKENYGESPFEINKEANEALNKKMYGK